MWDLYNSPRAYETNRVDLHVINEVTISTMDLSALYKYPHFETCIFWTHNGKRRSEVVSVFGTLGEAKQSHIGWVSRVAYAEENARNGFNLPEGMGL